MQNIEANNRLIAEFMGARFREFKSFPGYLSARLHDGIYSLDELEYHVSMEWLLPVVEHIQGLGYSPYNPQMVLLEEAKGSIETLYPAVLNFVICFNAPLTITKN